MRRGKRERRRRVEEKKDELRRFRRRIKREENKLAKERIRNVGRWSDGKKRRGSRAQKITSARVHNPVLILLPSKPFYWYPQKFATARLSETISHALECRHAVSLARLSLYAAKVSVECHSSSYEKLMQSVLSCRSWDISSPFLLKLFSF